jgi:hypothetical protein
MYLKPADTGCQSIFVVRLDVRVFLICVDIDDVHFSLPTRSRLRDDWCWRRRYSGTWGIVVDDTLELKHSSWSVLLFS